MYAYKFGDGHFQLKIFFVSHHIRSFVDAGGGNGSGVAPNRRCGAARPSSLSSV